MLDIREEIEEMEVDLRCPRGLEGFSSLSFENIDIHFMMKYMVIVGGGVNALVAFYLCTDEESRGETVREAKAFSLKSHVWTTVFSRMMTINMDQN
jgi:hypothetical protein